MADASGRIEMEGYVTAVSSAVDGARELYLHSKGPTVLVVVDPGTRGADVPLGPEHRVRVIGRLGGDERLPTLRAERIQVLA